MSLPSAKKDHKAPKLTVANALGMSVNLGIREFSQAFSTMPRSQFVKSQLLLRFQEVFDYFMTFSLNSTYYFDTRIFEVLHNLSLSPGAWVSIPIASILR